MSRQPTFSQRRRPMAVLTVAVWATLFAAVPAAAQHRARLSADLADHLAAGSQTINVIVHGDKATVDALAARYNVRVKRYLADGAVLRVTAGQLAALRDDGDVDHLSGDVRIRSSVADVTAEAIGADQVWAGAGELPALSGRGVTVAVIDSGIDTRHNALRKRVIATHDFTGGDGLDLYGHGTHVAAIIAGQAGRTADTRDYRGIAAGANLVNLRVLGADGSGDASDVVDAIDWAVAHRQQYRIGVINLSLGAPVTQPYRDDPLCEAVERAVRKGIVVVAAAGNYGKTKDGKSVYGAIASPGNSPYALTVGALDTHGTPQRSDDTLASYSSKGPTRYDLVIKPDLVAPGSHIVSAEATDAYLSKTYPERHVTGIGANAYMQLSGTSMAAGVVSGAVALLLDERRGLKPADTKAILQLTSSFMPSAGLFGVGAGQVNVLAAVEFAADPEAEPNGSIAGETQRLSGFVITLPGKRALSPSSIVWLSSIVWGATGDPIILGVSGDSIVWGSSGDSIVWGSAVGDSIVWGSSAGDSIVWGSADAI